MSKVIVYTLTKTGEIPEYVVNGGMFAKENDSEFPQNLTLVGIADNSAPEKAITTKANLISYVETYKSSILTPDGEMPVSDVVSIWWDNNI